MQFYYGSLMPLRILDEVEFWKQNEEEHTVVIRSLVTNLDQEYVKQLKDWETAFSKTHQTSERYIESVKRSGNEVSPSLYEQVMQFVSFCLNESIQFIKLCQTLREESPAISGNHTAKVVLDHIIRESEYFVGIAQTLLYSQNNQ